MHNNDQTVEPNGRFTHDFALTIILFVLMMGSWIAQFYTGWVAFGAEQMAHGQAPQMWGDSGYMWEFMAATFENWQSEFLQLWAFVVLTTYFIHRNSPQSRDNDDKLSRRVRRIEEIVERLEEKK